MEKTKNCWVIPTDKPSRLFKLSGDLHLHEECGIDPKRNQHIYITSDSDLDINDWVTDGKDIWQVSYILADNIQKAKKIILTTDQDLIKDGVQAIDDDFLEWFVKNPSCEEVKVFEQYRKCCRNTDGKNENCIEPINCEGWLNDEYKRPYKTNCEERFEGYKIIIPKEEPKQCNICKMFPRLEGTNKCEGCYSVVRYFLEQDPRFKDNLLPDLRKEQETSSVGAENQIFKIVLDEKWRPNKVSMIETDNNSVLNKQETLEEITEQIQKDCHKFVESIISKVTYQDATNTFLFMKLAELTLKLKKYE